LYQQLMLQRMAQATAEGATAEAATAGKKAVLALEPVVQSVQVSFGRLKYTEKIQRKNYAGSEKPLLT